MDIKHQDTLTLAGVSRLRAWKKGELTALMAQGLSLAEAQQRAEPVFENVAHNLVVTTGKTLAAKFLAGKTTTFLAYCAIGTSATAPAAGDTGLGAEVARKAKTMANSSGAVATWSVFFLSTEATYHLQECGWFGDTSASGTAGSGTLFSHWLQNYDNSAGTYDLTIDYSLTIS